MLARCRDLLGEHPREQRPEREARRGDAREVSGKRARRADDGVEVVGERHHARPGAHDAHVGEPRDDPHGDGGVAGRALPDGRVARGRRHRPRRPAAADDERAARGLLERQSPADVLDERAEEVLARLRDVDVQALASHRHAQPAEARDLPGPGAGGVDDPPRADRAARGRDVEPAGRRRRRDPAHRRMRADRGAVAGRPQRVERSRVERVGVALGRTPARSDHLLGEIRREAAQLRALEHVRLEPGALLDHALVVQQAQLLRRLGDHQPAGDVHLEIAVELTLELPPERRRLDVEADLGQQAVGDALDLEPGQLMDRDLQVEAAGVGAGRLAVELPRSTSVVATPSRAR